MSPRTKLQNEKIKEERKKLIMQTALELFANEGYHNTSISKIAKASNMSKGLMYNYFESKEELLKELFQCLQSEITDMIDPNHDNHITDDEAENFFDILFDSIEKKPTFWKLYFQLSTQTEVFEKLHDNGQVERSLKIQQLIVEYILSKGHKDPMVSMVLISSVIKGFCIQYVFAPEMFNEELIKNVKNKIKELVFNS